MATIKDKLYFNFDGQNSFDFNLIHVSIGSGMYEERFGASREIVETKVSGSRTPNFNRVELSPLEFDLNLAFEGEYDNDLIDNVVRWLFVDYYKPLYFIGEENKIYHCMPVGEPTLVHNGLSQGYITLQMRCNSPYKYSPIYLSDLFDSTNGDAVIKIPNYGHEDIYPQVMIDKIGNGNITLINRTNGGKTLLIEELLDNEHIFLDFKKEIIETSIDGEYRYENVSGDFFELLYGENTIEIVGDCQIQFRYQNIYKF